MSSSGGLAPATGMKILYGLNGTGYGHVCRSREIIRRLKRRGHDVKVIFSGGAPELNTEDFEPYEVYRGFTFVTARGRVQYLKTALGVNLLRFYRDVASVDASGFDLVINDWEPITARVAKRQGIPSIGIGHQYAFVFRIPTARGNPFGRFVLRRYAPADHPVGLHWHHFDHPILPPIVPTGLRATEPPVDRKILVYLPWEDPREMSRELGSVESHDFYIYHSSFTRASDQGNLHYRPPSRAAFLDDLTSCSGVVCNAGFELPSEALHLGKKLLVKPQGGQMEQESNALALSCLGLGTAVRRLRAASVESWLDSPAVAPMEYPDVAGAIVSWIERRRWDDVASLARSLWAGNGDSAASYPEDARSVAGKPASV